MPQTPFNYLEAFRIDQWYKITSLVEKWRKNGIKFLVVFSAKQVALHVIFQLALVSFPIFFCYSYNERCLSDFFWLIRARFWLFRFLQSKEQAMSEAALKMCSLKVRRKITPFYLKFLYETMPRRMKAVVDAQGGHTKHFMYFLDGIFNIFWINCLYLKKVTNFWSR